MIIYDMLMYVNRKFKKSLKNLKNFGIQRIFKEILLYTICKILKETPD